jgi:hypothetical protein
VTSLPNIPDHIKKCREKVASLLKCLKLTRQLTSQDEMALFLSSRTNGGRSLPHYYLVYFLLIDLLDFLHFGKGEKVAWSVPIQYQERLYVIEHRKMGLGIFEPQHDRTKYTNSPTTEQGEQDSVEICNLIRRAVEIANPYFQWRAELQAKGSQLNVVNHSNWLFDRYEFFKSESGRFKLEYQNLKDKKDFTAAWNADKCSNWSAQSAIEAFFSWTEHTFIHLAILQSKIKTGEEVREIAAADWKAKFKAAFDLTDQTAKKHYDLLLDLRAQIRNFLAHGSFGKRGEAFSFHSGAGAVPLLITESIEHPFHISGRPSTQDFAALTQIEDFIQWLWSTPLAAAKPYIDSGLPLILSYTHDGTYTQAMTDTASMLEFV